LNKSLHVSIVAVLNADGAHEKLTAVLNAAQRLQLLSAIQYKLQQQHLSHFFNFQIRGFSLVDSSRRAGGAESLLQILGPSVEISLKEFASLKQLALRVDTAPERVGSVTVIIKQLVQASPDSPPSVANIAVARTMEFPPYIIELRAASIEPQQNHQHPFRVWKPREGIYEITATVYREFGCKGDIMASSRSVIRFLSDLPEATPASTDDHAGKELEKDDVSDDENVGDEVEDSSVDFSSESDDEEPSTGANATSTALDGPAASKTTIESGEGLADRRSLPAKEPMAPPSSAAVRRGIRVDADDAETLERIRAEKRKKSAAIVIPEEDDDKPLPDYFELPVETLLTDQPLQRLLKPTSFSLISSKSESEDEPSWTLFLKSPNETVRVVLLDGVSPSWTVHRLKEELASKVKERPLKTMRLYFYHTLALREETLLRDIPNLGNFSTLLMLRKGQSVTECLAAL
jgi:hypothetical protein